MIVKSVYHVGIPVDDVDRAQSFYTQVLGMELIDQVGQEGARQSRLKCGPNTVVLFQRPKALNRNSFEEDGVFHQAFEIDISEFDDAVEKLKEIGAFHRIIERESGLTGYFFDTEGNYEELHASR